MPGWTSLRELRHPAALPVSNADQATNVTLQYSRVMRKTHLCEFNVMADTGQGRKHVIRLRTDRLETASI